ncbi:glycosyl-4,4'-diaponeurosporenoate acyltransferase CrtO family protein [Tannockella kyphosi]|uniref:glycosyl-4,4'-diaponeurosporenoate acyltransferase CrtO family protein n=1 Tax=Tannockella kyphosi TaxID=2899121 RepID=UPI002012CEC9|nr:hypothetical protein [Tannockella kyphosi]
MEKTMKKLATFSSVVAIVLWIVNCLVTASILSIMMITFLTTAYHFDMRLLVGTILGKKYQNIDPNNSWFQEKRFEKKLYNLLGVRSWKKHIPTYSPNSFDLNKTELPEILRNTCTSEIVHEAIVICSFIPVLISLTIPFLRDDVVIFLITSILAACVDSIFIIVQRYNRPRLRKIIARKKPN